MSVLTAPPRMLAILVLKCTSINDRLLLIGEIDTAAMH